ncbi:MAG: hypothetical protein Q4G40_04745, partial [Brachybacterium sp.]|nr:hypothetical protein [Brachybacterium sp.]
LLTDAPTSSRADEAEEVLALEAVSLALRFDGDLPPLVRDWAVEVRGASDQLQVPLGAWSGPVSRDPVASGPVPCDPGSPSAAASHAPHTAGPVLIPADGATDDGAAIGALLAARAILGPAEAVTPQQAQEEGVPA